MCAGGVSTGTQSVSAPMVRWSLSQPVAFWMESVLDFHIFFTSVSAVWLVSSA